MMRALNIQQLAAVEDLELFQLYERKLSFRTTGDDIASHEVSSLISLVKALEPDNETRKYFNGFFLSYQIPRISKEFDLLRIGEKEIINIELKSKVVDEKDIKKQLIRNRYYLGHLKKEIYSFTYIEETGKFYELSKDAKLEEVEPSKIISKLKEQKKCRLDNIESLFEASKFLVSPLNSPDEFLEGEYFLTSGQEQIKASIINEFTSSIEAVFQGLKGEAGTGKTLLLYDIAFEYGKEHKVCIIHCGKLCEGHNILDKKSDNVDIIPVKEVPETDFSKYKFIFVDESHRFYENQFKQLCEAILVNKIKVLFSYDENQILSRKEIEADIVGTISSCAAFKKHNITNKIRTNPEIISFIKKLMDCKRTDSYKTYPSVSVFYAKNADEANGLLRALYDKPHLFLKKLINYTPFKNKAGLYDDYQSFYNTHGVIGQEFDEVVMYINENFCYNSEGKLIASTPHPNSNYLLEKMLYQGLTRARDKLTLIVVNNPSVFKTLLEKTHVNENKKIEKKTTIKIIREKRILLNDSESHS
ncbi:TPA: ATP-binding protein [Listeria monocytogenes]|nr:ATP-binding protein [Listeria monocytogenes]